MIALLQGTIAEKTQNTVIVLCGGVGYEAWVDTEDFGRLALGQSANLYIYEHIREQSHDLYGFIDKKTKDLFEILLGVNGVGPKMALAVLSVAPAEEVKRAISLGDIGLLKAANGVGKRVAERIIVDLKDKVGLAGSEALYGTYGAKVSFGDEAVDALISLGFSTLDAQRVLSDIDPSLKIEERIRLALQKGVR